MEKCSSRTKFEAVKTADTIKSTAYDATFGEAEGGFVEAATSPLAEGGASTVAEGASAVDILCDIGIAILCM